ncbi:MAG: TIGR04295 family B12-binding domain-containing radical SAM protein, partial [Chloroflexota bacterium]
GPHGSSTPESTLRKFGAAVGSWELAGVLGECEEVLAALVERLPGRGLAEACREVPSVAFWDGEAPRVNGGPHAARLGELPALRWRGAEVARHTHHHHRFEGPFSGPGAEMEVSRGCPYRCSFCAKEHFRNKYRKRPLPVVLEELDGLLAQGITYCYFIDEIFLPDASLLNALAERRQARSIPFHFGMQTRIDLWEPALLELLEAAGCVSIEAGVESITEAGRAALNKRCKLTTEQLTERLTMARRYVPFVQANLLDSGADDPMAIERWREELLAQGVWANKPVPMLFYPGSPGYATRWGAPDEQAWERAHASYLKESREFADFQDQEPRPLSELEAAGIV